MTGEAATISERRPNEQIGSASGEALGAYVGTM